ncbi:MCE family protein [Kutzneria viridogrisea]|uniref:MCE family protein n=2 Tax=Kutzneria TaxID=43356 RepID=W5WK68_9PSEU|nr:MCE family protein [Kutzneria albida]AHI01599.1 hypothetical protein KALB_8241 [Kutzneria albida DSM 43870]MBA8931563.1 phospholipid/cholesterol/gamma-HCH transport system substrate-binding protein [Kutzneria viridogrisea]
MKRRVGVAIASVLALTAVGGCGVGEFGGVYNLPLPGGADLGSHPYQVHVEFKDVLDLVPQAGVKVNDVAVGKVTEIGLAKDGWTAEVTVAVNGDVKLPANASAQLRQSSLLGEKYVELVAPNNGTGALANGATIPLDRTNRNPEVEEVFGALSLLLNGGGVGQIQDITKELNNALSGNEPQIRSLLTNVNSLVSNLDAHRGDITRALDGLNRLSGTLNSQRDQIAGAIDNLGPGLAVLTQQRDQLVTMLQSLSTLSGVAVDTVNKSKDDLIADLKDLQPTLTKLAAAGQALPKSLEILLTYPFPDAAVAGVKGDYTNLYANLDLNLGDVLENLGRSRQNAIPNLPGLSGLTGGTVGGQPVTPLPLPNLPVTPQSGGSNTNGLGGLLSGLLGGGH